MVQQHAKTKPAKKVKYGKRLKVQNNKIKDVHFRLTSEDQKRIKETYEQFQYDNLSKFMRDIPLLLDQNRLQSQINEIYQIVTPDRNSTYLVSKLKILFFLFRHNLDKMDLQELKYQVYMNSQYEIYQKAIKDLRDSGFIKIDHDIQVVQIGAVRQEQTTSRVSLTAEGRRLAAMAVELLGVLNYTIQEKQKLDNIQFLMQKGVGPMIAHPGKYVPAELKSKKKEVVKVLEFMFNSTTYEHMSKEEANRFGQEYNI